MTTMIQRENGRRVRPWNCSSNRWTLSVTSEPNDPPVHGVHSWIPTQKLTEIFSEMRSTTRNI